MAKKLIVFILSVIFAVICSLHVFSVSVVVDGNVNERAWIDTSTYVLVSATDVSNNAVEFATAAVLSEDNYLLYLGFKVNVGGSINETTPHGVRISINNGDFIEISRQGVSAYDTSLYNITAAVQEYSSTSYRVEMSLGIKYGLDNVDSIRVQFIDGNGDNSNTYPIPLPQQQTEETTTYAQSETTTKKLTDNTTRITTTKKETTAKRTTTERTTKGRTTAEKTTKEKTTKETTTKKQTTKRTAESITVKTVTVYITVPVAAESSAQTTLDETVTTAAEEETQSGSMKPYKELTYFGIAGLLILTFGICVMVNMTNDRNKTKNEK